MTRADEQNRLALALDDVSELFTAPAPGPLAGRFRTSSGVDRLMTQVEPGGTSALVLEIELTCDGVPAELEQRIRPALDGHCAERIESIWARRAQVRRLGLKELRFGVVFLAACLAVGSVLSAGHVGPEWFRTFVGEGLVIVGWISMWHPVDMLFFERFPLIRDQRVLCRILRADVRVLLHGQAAGRSRP